MFLFRRTLPSPLVVLTGQNAANQINCLFKLLNFINISIRCFNGDRAMDVNQGENTDCQVVGIA
jgi:hypothetical protein